MSNQYSGKQVKTIAQVQARELSLLSKRDNVRLVREDQTELFCYRASYRAGPETNLDTRFDDWCNRAETLAFLETLSQDPSAAGKAGNIQPSETVFTLILDRDLFEKIMTAFRMPDRVREVICSIHGVFARFVEHDGDNPRSLLILLSTPKSPMREVFCAMRIAPEPASVTCLLFDAQPADLGRVVGLLRRSPPGLAWRSPVAFLAMLAGECGRTSELKRKGLDDDILGAECQTRSTLWGGVGEPEKIPGEPLARWPDDFYAATSAMHLCRNNMMFVARAVDFEIAVWRHLRLMVTKEPLLMWLRASAGESEWVSIQDDIQFEISHTVERKAQIECLKERIAVQVNLLDNKIAHHESSQTNLIALLALVFAPASLIASIFSTGIVATNERSWIAYVATTVPVTLITVIAGLSFLESQRFKRAWRLLQGSSKP